jgi:hypothetical protein
MVPGAESIGLVAPRMRRPIFTASRPSQTMATMGPEAMSTEVALVYSSLRGIEKIGRDERREKRENKKREQRRKGRDVQATRPGKNGFLDRSA